MQCTLELERCILMLFMLIVLYNIIFISVLSFVFCRSLVSEKTEKSRLDSARNNSIIFQIDCEGKVKATCCGFTISLTKTYYFTQLIKNKSPP